MNGSALRESRKRRGLTQVEAAKRLGVSQTYLSLLENGRRDLTEEVARRAVSKLDVSPTALPFEGKLKQVKAATNAGFARDLASLRYPGLSQMRSAKKRNPAAALLSALRAEDLERRLVEALPWMLLNFSDLQWDELVDAAKVNDLQNRLGFLTALARQLAARQKDREKESMFARREEELLPSKLAREDTLCRESMTESERKWLRRNRPPEAKRWNVLSDLKVEHLTYA
ncbi:MAG: helix-turn-helix transcriptional regulator [Acidobacteriota bacterium]|nr:MAG: helix-turn-helix transcriptional regulator [Acidobacteriota bacterium]